MSVKERELIAQSVEHLRAEGDKEDVRLAAALASLCYAGLRDVNRIADALERIASAVERGRHKEPCGECHLQPGETCDICGAVAAAGQ